MKILIFGALGFLGTKLRDMLLEDHEVIGLDTRRGENTHELDATNKLNVENFIMAHKPDIVINTIALTSSLDCERDPLKAYKLNYLITKNIVEACKLVNTKLIFFSSSYIFDGKKGDYNEESLPNPLNEYGKTKIMAEKEVLQFSNSLILRIDAMYGYNGKNKPNGLFNQILSGENIKLRNPSQIRQPVLIEDVVKTLFELVDKNQTGIFHVAGTNHKTIYQLFRGLESIMRKESKIIFSTKREISIKTPQNSTLNISKIQNLEIKTHSFEEGLEIIRKQISEEL